MIFTNITTLQSWWTWDNVDRADLWHKCVYDNNTGSLMCASATENGTHASSCLNRYEPMIISPTVDDGGLVCIPCRRLVAVGAGAHGHVRDPLFHLLHRVHLPALYQVKEGTLLLQRAFPDLCR